MPRQSATTESNWFANPNSGQRELIPPRGSMIPWYKNQPHADTSNTLEKRFALHERVLPSGRQILPRKSWSKKRPTRVPASMVVRMNKASNMIAKWYQSASAVGPAEIRANMCAIPTAKVGAPPARLNMVDSPRSEARWVICCSVTGKPAALTLATTSVGVPFELIAKYSPGCSTHAAIIAIKATIISVTMAP